MIWRTLHAWPYEAAAETTAGFGRGGGGGGGAGGVHYWLFGLQLTAGQLLFAVLALQALGVVGGGGDGGGRGRLGGLLDVGLLVDAAGAALGLGARRWGVL